jgi:beta-1,2-mannobiose phosphorylase / 1,2-beta-oligomannan phosphorylase
MLNSDDPLKMLYRSEKPILEPEDEAESVGVVDNVVFPTALDARGAGRFDVYYGMADTRIGVVQIDLPYGFL